MRLQVILAIGISPTRSHRTDEMNLEHARLVVWVYVFTNTSLDIAGCANEIVLQSVTHR